VAQWRLYWNKSGSQAETAYCVNPLINRRRWQNSSPNFYPPKIRLKKFGYSNTVSYLLFWNCR